MSNFADVEFSDLEEIGYRLKAVRLSEGLSVNSVRVNHMTHVAYDSLEDGRGSLNGLSEVAKILGIKVVINVQDGNGFNVDTDLDNIRTVFQKYREDNDLTRSRISTLMGVPYASVIVLESAEKPRVRSFGRYIEALGLKLTISMFDKNGEGFVPAKVLNKDQLDKLRKDYKYSFARDLGKVKIPSKVGEMIKSLREKNKLSKAEVSRRSNIKEASIVKVENGDARVVTAKAVVDAMGYELYAVIKGKEVDTDDITTQLDLLRVEMGYTLSDFARKIGTTYRTVKIFPSSKTNFANIARYADGLGITVKYKTRKKN